MTQPAAISNLAASEETTTAVYVDISGHWSVTEQENATYINFIEVGKFEQSFT